MGKRIVKIITKIIEGNPNNHPNLEEIHTFVEKYAKAMKNKNITGEELQKIMSMINARQFDLHYAAKQYAAHLGYQTYEVTKIQTGQVLKRGLYEIQ